jgi:hypothetical protein
VGCGKNDNASSPLRFGTVALGASAVFVQTALARTFATVAGTGTDFGYQFFPFKGINALAFHRFTRGAYPLAD